ncbi:hypothetical protein L9F63_005382, partial [Diploptera punctata]
RSLYVEKLRSTSTDISGAYLVGIHAPQLLESRNHIACLISHHKSNFLFLIFFPSSHKLAICNTFSQYSHPKCLPFQRSSHVCYTGCADGTSKNDAISFDKLRFEFFCNCNINKNTLWFRLRRMEKKVQQLKILSRTLNVIEKISHFCFPLLNWKPKHEIIAILAMYLIKKKHNHS